jgi:DNA-directed RNA polymerase subunit E'/Rpb7
LTIYVSRTGIAESMTFDSESTYASFISEDQSIKITKDVEVRLKINGIKLDTNGEMVKN